MNAPATTPTTETPKATESALTRFIESCKNEKLNDTDRKKIAEKFKKFIGKKQAALDALKALEAEETEVSKDMVRAYGKKRLSIDGQDYAPSSRDERIYYKSMSGGSVEL